MIDLDIENLQAKECVIGETRFVLDKMGAMESWGILERIREQVGTTLDLNMSGVQSQLGIQAATTAAFVRVVLGLPAVFLDDLRKRMFKHVRYRQFQFVAFPPAWKRGYGL